MAGIFGYEIYSNDYVESKICSCLIRHAQQAFKHSSKNAYINNGKAGLGFVLPYCDPSWPLKSDDGEYYFQLFGHIILPDISKLDNENLQNDFLKPYLKSKHEFLCKLNGAFVFALYDKMHQTFTLINDPFGNFSMYYFCDSKLCVFSSQLHAIT